MPEPYVSIPETITVHLGAPSSNAQNVTVPFAVYTVEISAEGYTPLTALHIAMFSGVPTMLPVALTPLAENQSFAQTDLTATGAPQALDPELPENP